jgi:hypothetical protein
MNAVQRLIDEMKRRNYAAKTTTEYAASIRRLGTHFGCCPSKLSLEQRNWDWSSYSTQGCSKTHLTPNEQPTLPP